MLDVAIWSEIYTLFEPLPAFQASLCGNVPHAVQLPLCGVVPGSLPTASHPARSTYSIAPGLFRPWLCQKLPWESENKKSVRIATFLRLGIVAWLQIADRGVKTWIIGHKAADFRFAGAEGSP